MSTSSRSRACWLSSDREIPRSQYHQAVAAASDCNKYWKVINGASHARHKSARRCVRRQGAWNPNSRFQHDKRSGDDRERVREQRSWPWPLWMDLHVSPSQSLRIGSHRVDPCRLNLRSRAKGKQWIMTRGLSGLWPLSRRQEGTTVSGLQICWIGIVGWWAMDRDREWFQQPVVDF